MSSIGDSLAALKNVLMMQERIDGLRVDVARTSMDLRLLPENLLDVDRRVARIEGFVEGAAAASRQGRIEG